MKLALFIAATGCLCAQPPVPVPPPTTNQPTFTSTVSAFASPPNILRVVSPDETIVISGRVYRASDLVAAFAQAQPVGLPASPATISTTVTAAQPANVRAGCTPTSMAAAKAGSLAAAELGRWTCYAQNLGTTPQLVSLVGFSLDFIELHQVGTPDVADIFGQKQAMSKAGKAARAMEVIGVAAGIGLGLSGITLTAKAVAAIGTSTYAAGKLGDYFNRRIPSSTNALSGQWGAADTVLLPVGGGIQWRVYASKMHNATQIGPKILTPVPMP